MVPETQKQAVKRWQKENMTHLQCKVLKADADALKTLAYRNGTSVNAVLIAAVKAYIGRYDGAGPDSE